MILLSERFCLEVFSFNLDKLQWQSDNLHTSVDFIIKNLYAKCILKVNKTVLLLL